MTKRDIILWIAFVLIMAFGIWLCRGSVKALVPPRPKLPHKILRSPKDAANQPMLFTLPVVNVPQAIVIPPVPITNHLTLAWQDGRVPSDRTNTIVFEVDAKSVMGDVWYVLGYTTNVTTFKFDSTNRSGFYRVGAFWP